VPLARHRRDGAAVEAQPAKGRPAELLAQARDADGPLGPLEISTSGGGVARGAARGAHDAATRALDEVRQQRLLRRLLLLEGVAQAHGERGRRGEVSAVVAVPQQGAVCDGAGDELLSAAAHAARGQAALQRHAARRPEHEARLALLAVGDPRQQRRAQLGLEQRGGARVGRLARGDHRAEELGEGGARVLLLAQLLLRRLARLGRATLLWGRRGRGGGRRGANLVELERLEGGLLGGGRRGALHEGLAARRAADVAGLRGHAHAACLEARRAADDDGLARQAVLAEGARARLAPG